MSCVDNLLPNEPAVISSCGQLVVVMVIGPGGLCPCCERPAYRVLTEALQELDVCSTLLSRPH
jgi:bacterioferritin-associated ferredoxin